MTDKTVACQHVIEQLRRLADRLEAETPQVLKAEMTVGDGADMIGAAVVDYLRPITFVQIEIQLARK